jgi:hypothetical protein
MKFYSINGSLNKEIVGHNNQVINAIHHCDVWEDLKFIDNIDFKKVDFEPITSNAILEKQAKLTDLINASCVGFSLKLLVSDSLKNIIEKYSENKCQFFKSPVIHNKEMINKYWVTNPYNFSMEFIDFKMSTITVRVRKKEGGTEKVILDIIALNDFMESVKFHWNKEEIVTIDNILLKDDITDDFFILRHVEGGIKYIVSENLKQEIEEEGCSGIEFQPIELSYNEWVALGGEREKIYGSF